jgi:hypothetical protein
MLLAARDCAFKLPAARAHAGIRKLHAAFGDRARRRFPAQSATGIQVRPHAARHPAGEEGIIASRLNLAHEHFSRILHEFTGASLIKVEGRRAHPLQVGRLGLWRWRLIWIKPPSLAVYTIQLNRGWRNRAIEQGSRDTDSMTIN